MGETLMAFFQPVLDFFGHDTAQKPTQQPMVAGYRVDYSAIPSEEITAPAPCDAVVESTQWISVNRRA